MLNFHFFEVTYTSLDLLMEIPRLLVYETGSSAEAAKLCGASQLLLRSIVR